MSAIAQARASAGPAATGWRNDRVAAAFALLALSSIFLMKLGLNLSDGAVGMNAALIWVALGWLAVSGVLEVAPLRLTLLALTLCAVVLSLLLNGQPLKLSALGLVLFMYAGLVFQVRVEASLARRCIAIFLKAMLLIAFIVVAQQLIQYSIGSRFWPNLDLIIPEKFQYSGFAYYRPYAWNSPYFEPNGVFFLEPSALSGYLALALVAEIVFFRRWFYMAGFVVGMLACLAVTGFAILAITAPFLVSKLDRRLLLAGALLLGPLILAALGTHWLAPLLARSDELGASNSSGYARIQLPLKAITDVLSHAGTVFTGNGPGSSPRQANLVQWPFSKLLYEYGFLTALTFHVFLLTSVLGSPPSRILAWALVVPQLFFGGGFLSPSNVMPLIFLCTLLRVEGRVEAPASPNVALWRPRLRALRPTGHVAPEAA